VKYAVVEPGIEQHADALVFEDCRCASEIGQFHGEQSLLGDRVCRHLTAEALLRQCPVKSP
jgi:hypothetical protein